MSKIKEYIDGLGTAIPEHMVSSLIEAYDAYVTAGAPEKIAIYRAISLVHKQLFAELNTLKVSLQLPPDESPVDDRLQRIMAVRAKYDKSIKDATPKEEPEIPEVKPEPKQEPENITEQLQPENMKPTKTLANISESLSPKVIETKTPIVKVGECYNLSIPSHDGKEMVAMPTMVYEGLTKKGFHRFVSPGGEARNLTTQVLNRTNVSEAQKPKVRRNSMKK